jgi:hypothetical protein
MLGQRPARRLAPRKWLHRHALRCGDLFCRLRLGLILLQREQLQLELVEQGSPLRRLPEPLMLQLGDPVLELIDPQRLVTKLGAMRLPLGQQHRLQRLDVVGKGSIGLECHSAIVGSACWLATPTAHPSRHVASVFAEASFGYAPTGQPAT